MAKVNALLSERLKQGKRSTKMATLAQNSSNGSLTGFAGVFGVRDLGEEAKKALRNLLERYAPEEEVSLEQDLRSLVAITSEVRAISNQAALLHGERIKRAQTILKLYRDGAFTAWLVTTYGNRQTPYNFLQYYEFYESMPKQLRPQIESMPRQAIYTLASRDGAINRKQEIVEKFQGQTKDELLTLIRRTFPLDMEDQRRENVGDALLATLKRAYGLLDQQRKGVLSKPQKERARHWLDEIQLLLGE
jgi:hypothetical protein